MPNTQKIFQNFCKICFSNRLKVFYSPLLSGCGFFGTRVETKKNFVRSNECVTHGYVFIQARYQVVYFIIIFLKVYWTICSRLATLKVDEILSMGAKYTLYVEIPYRDKLDCLAFRLKRNRARESTTTTTITSLICRTIQVQTVLQKLCIIMF